MEEIKFKVSVKIETFTPKDLETGMIGVMSNGRCFIIVNDLIVYQDGGYDYVSYLNKYMKLSTGTYIEKVYKDCNSFELAKNGYGTQVYPVPLPKLTLSQIKDMIGFDFELVNE